MIFLELPVDRKLTYFTSIGSVRTFVLNVPTQILQIEQFFALAAITLKCPIAGALFSYVLLESFEREYFFFLLIDSAFVIELGCQNMQLPISRHLLHERHLLCIGLAGRTFVTLFLLHSLDACSAKQVLTNFTFLWILVGKIKTHATIVLFHLLVSVFVQS